MIFNLWRPYKWFKPKTDGIYLCTVAHGAGENIPKVMELKFTKWNSKWIRAERQNVFDGYQVYESCRAPIHDNLVYSDSECERIDVIAWKKLPRCYSWWRKMKG